MQLKRRNNRAEAVSSKVFDDIADYIRMIIDVYSATSIRRDLWLTEREKQFFIATVIHVTDGHANPISEPSVQIYKNYFSPATDKIKIADYINRVRNKEWILYNKRLKKVTIPPIFTNMGQSMSFNLEYRWDNQNDSEEKKH